jgi:hypothetical protein
VWRGDVNPGALLGFIALVPIPNEEGGILPPHSVLAPGTALGLLPSIALPSARVSVIVAAEALLGNRTKEI